MRLARGTFVYPLPMSNRLPPQILALDLGDIYSKVPEDTVMLDLVNGNVFKNLIQDLVGGVYGCPICLNEATYPV